ncbi:MAG: PD-(D/E)XK nuclease family protein [Chthoniobacteraceae bacterium]
MIPAVDDISTEALLLRKIGAFNQRIVSNVTALLKRDDLRKLRLAYEVIRARRNVDLGFNLFAIVTELYYRENFHSDVLRALLDPNSKHQDGSVFLDLFLAFLKRHGAKVSRCNYSNASVVREEGRVDILVRDESSKRAIIIENKINGAADMPRQLPRYVEYANNQGYEVDAIVYLRLNRLQHPDKTDWTVSERTEIEAKLLCLNAYDESGDDLFEGWLRPCQDAALDSEAAHIFKQYSQLIIKLGKNTMNKPIMDQFYQLMKEGDNYTSARSLMGMLDDLVLFRVEKIIDTFKSDLAPFTGIANYKDYDAYFTGCRWHKVHLGIDIGVDAEGYVFQFWDRDDREGKNGYARLMLKKMNSLSDYSDSGGQFEKRFTFPDQESNLIAHIKDFKVRLALTLAAEATES